MPDGRLPEPLPAFGVLIQITSAGEGDVDGVVAAMAANRADLSLFQRSPRAVRRALGDFVVARDGGAGGGGEIVACAALHRYSARWCEILSVAVLPGEQGRGVGRALMAECARRAAADGVREIFLATAKPDYFARFGFNAMTRWRLPPWILLAKLVAVGQQPVGRWLPAIFGRHTFMRRLVA